MVPPYISNCGPRETVYTPKTWHPVFLLASDTRGDDLTETGDRWRQLQIGIRPKISCLFPNLVSTHSPEFGPQLHLCLSRVWGWTPFYAMF